ncbi:MAG: hypothetical protein IT350_12855 [Deltaproteobacteria bacterium]|nr:hypothetical protein [Deltaproteobacteria bacterium]
MRMRWFVTWMIGSLFFALALTSASCGDDDDDDDEAASTTKTVRLELDSIEVGAGGGAKASPPEGAACAATTMNALLADAGIGPADVDLTDISLHSMRASYSDASWSGDSEAVIAMLTFYGTQFPPVNGATIDLEPGSADEQDVVVSPEVREFVEYFFTNRDEEFSHCVSPESAPADFGATISFVLVVNATTEPFN